jgi:hypothetical protein
MLLAKQCRNMRKQFEHRQHNHVVLGTGDGANQVLLLLVVSVKECQLLIAMGGVIEHVDVQGDFTWRLVERVDKAFDEPIFQPQ